MNKWLWLGLFVVSVAMGVVYFRSKEKTPDPAAKTTKIPSPVPSDEPLHESPFEGTGGSGPLDGNLTPKPPANRPNPIVPPPNNIPPRNEYVPPPPNPQEMPQYEPPAQNRYTEPEQFDPSQQPPPPPPPYEPPPVDDEFVPPPPPPPDAGDEF